MICFRQHDFAFNAPQHAEFNLCRMHEAFSDQTGNLLIVDIVSIFRLQLIASERTSLIRHIKFDIDCFVDCSGKSSQFLS